MHILVLLILHLVNLSITAVGSTQHTVTNAVYTASNGRLVLTSAGHGFANGDYIKVADGSLTFTCDLDGNTAQKAYPRANYDYPSGRWLQISNVTTDTFEINVGNSSYTGDHTFVSATANGIERQDWNIHCQCRCWWICIWFCTFRKCSCWVSNTCSTICTHICKCYY